LITLESVAHFLFLQASSLKSQVSIFMPLASSLKLPVSSLKPLASSPLLLIDGFNVLHAGVLKGRDRAGWWCVPAQRRLIERVERFADASYPEIWIVFDRRAGRSDGQGGVASGDARIRVIYAPSADDWIAEQVVALSNQRPVTVVTSDRFLRERVHQGGGAILSPRQFLAACH
jgi:predicted RNA-binding protein with PIN domain